MWNKFIPFFFYLKYIFNTFFSENYFILEPAAFIGNKIVSIYIFFCESALTLKSTGTSSFFFGAKLFIDIIIITTSFPRQRNWPYHIPTTKSGQTKLTTNQRFTTFLQMLSRNNIKYKKKKRDEFILHKILCNISTSTMQINNKKI